jgi:hypothetical protein
VEPRDIEYADETAFLVCRQEIYTWAVKGAEAAHIYVARNNEQSHAVMAAVTMVGGKLPLIAIVQRLQSGTWR